MKIVIALLSVLLSISSLAFTIESKWTEDFIKILDIKCNQDDSYQCANLCDNYSQCSVKENYCRNCAGDNLFIKYTFKELGGKIKSTEEVDQDDFFDFITQGNFATLTSKSIFNFIDKYNSFELKERFRSLCKMPVEYPIVFIELNKTSRTPEKIKYVACSNIENSTNIYQLKKVFDVEVNE